MKKMQKLNSDKVKQLKNKIIFKVPQIINQLLPEID
jgi:hypothetical protein